MSKECLTIGTIQAFIDGELSPVEFAGVSAHTAACANCAQLLSQADEENSFVFASLERDIDTLVPTQRLWTRISESIETGKREASVWSRLASFVSNNFVTPAFATACGFLIVFGAAVFVFNSGEGQQPIADVPVPVSSGPNITVAEIAAPSQQSDLAGSPVPDSNGSGATPGRNVTAVSESNHSPDELRRIVRASARNVRQVRPQVQFLNYQYLPGEESYVKTIAELEQNNTGLGVRASGQVAYQRDLAVVDESIKRMRDVVRRNPRNQAARNVLYSSYQDKIDILNSAAQRDELMASLR